MGRSGFENIPHSMEIDAAGGRSIELLILLVIYVKLAGALEGLGHFMGANIGPLKKAYFKKKKIGV